VVDLADPGASGFEPPPGTDPLELSPTLGERRVEEEDPPCARSCTELARKGELRPGLPVSSCTLRLCRQAALRLYKDSRYEDALAALDHVREGGAGTLSYEVDRGIILYALGRYGEALTAFDRAVEVFPRSFRARAERARTLARLGRPKEARAGLESLVAEHFGGTVARSEGEVGYGGLRVSSYLLGNLGVLKLCDGEVAAGRSDLRRALVEDAQNVQAATMLENAVPALEAGTLAPDGVGILEGAFEDLGLGRLDSAVERFETLAERWPRFETTWWLVGGLHFSRLEYSECEDVFARAEAALPEITDFRVERIRCRILRYGEGSDERSAALTELRSLAEDHPDNRRARDLLSMLDL
jgi:tetratricopeptide (TPR) repeat protein